MKNMSNIRVLVFICKVLGNACGSFPFPYSQDCRPDSYGLVLDLLCIKGAHMHFIPNVCFT